MAITLNGATHFLLTEEEYRDLSARVMVAEGPLREAQAEALHWRAEHDRVCQALDAANVRADKAEAEERICQLDRSDGWGRYHDLQSINEELHRANRGLLDGQRSLMQERDEARTACKRLAIDLSRARLATEQEEAKVTRVMTAAIERDNEVAQLRSEKAVFAHQRDEARRERDEARAENAALREGQPLYFCVGLVPHRAVPHVVSVRVKYLSTDAAQGEDGTEAQGAAASAPRPTANYRATKLDPARRVPLHAVRPDERRE